MRMGLGYVGIDQEQQAKMSVQDKVDESHVHFGSPPLVIMSMWHDLYHMSIQEAQLEEKGMSEKGFK